MATSGSGSSAIFAHIVENSLFTPKQVSIISKRLQGAARAPNMSSGAYYRQVRQCRDKAAGVLYSVMLLQSSGVLGPEALPALARISEQLGVIFASENSDVSAQIRTDDVISVIDQLVKRVCKL